MARAARARGRGRGHVVSSRTEHKSVLDTCKQLEKEGFVVTLVEPDDTGRVLPETVRAALRADTLLVSLMLANNEIGVVSDIAAIAELCRARGVLVHTDASQAVGKLPVDVERLGVDFLSLTAHKFYGPKGIGALYVRESARPKIAPIQFGGGHERGLRSGTLPTHQIVGLGVAAAIALRRRRGRCRACARSRRAAVARARTDSRRPVQWAPGAAGPGIDQCFLCGRRRREPDHRPAGNRGVLGLGLQFRDARAELRAAFARPDHRARAELVAAVARDDSPPPPTWMRPPRPFAPRSRACACWRAAPRSRGRRRPPDAVGDSLMARTLNPLARRYFLAPRADSGIPGRGSGRPMCARGGPAGSPTEPRCFSSCRIADGIVKSARFSAYGCPHTVAVAGWLCEVLEGSRLDAGPPGTPADWAQKFEVPAEKLGRLLIVEDALRAALVQLTGSTMAISLTPAAAERVRTFIASRGKGLGLRLGVRKTGCSGFAYVVNYADDTQAQDLVFEDQGVKVFVDPESLPLINGTTVDFVKQGLNEAFRFHNPNIKGECGCGESFNV